MSCSLLTLCAVGILTQSASTDDVLSVLNKYASARGIFNRVSVACRYSANQVISHGGDIVSKEASETIAEFRRDNDRFEFIMTDVTDGTSAEDGGTTTQRLWNGAREYQVYRFARSEADNKDGYQVTLMKDNTIMKSLSLDLVYSTLTGIFHGDTRPFDEIVSTSSDGIISVRRETVGSSNCIVLESDNEHGQYQIWMDPERGYNIVKAIVTKGPDDIYLGRPVKSHEFGPAKHGETASGIWANTRTMTEVTTRIDNVTLEKRGDVWIPVSAEHQKLLKFSDSVINDLRMKCKVERLEVAPEFDKIDAFKVRVPNGTRVYVQEVPEIRYEWRDGEIVPFVDHTVLDELDGTIEKYKANAEPARTQPSADTSVAVRAGTDPETKKSAASTSNGRSGHRWLVPCVSGVMLLVVALGVNRVCRGKKK